MTTIKLQSIRSRCFVLVIAATFLGQTSLLSAEENEAIAVDQLLKAKFRRVTGPAHGGSTLDVGPKGSWYATNASSPTIHYDGTLYRMWFVGGTPTDDATVPYGWHERIGLATSRDGLSWKVVNDGKPVLDLGPPESFDAKGLAHPFVMHVDGKFMMWYGAIDGTIAKDLGLSPPHVRVERVCLATSDDGIHWKRANNGRPVMDIGGKGSIDSIQATGMHILKIDGEFVMWYGAYNGDHSFGLAKSPDGIHWTKANQGRSLTGLQGTEQLGPSVIFDGKQYFLLYNRPRNGAWYMYAASSSNGIDWKPAFGGKPVLGPPPKGNFGTAGRGHNHSVHSTQILRIGHKARVWYTAQEGSPPHYQRTGLMEALLR